MNNELMVNSIFSRPDILELAENQTREGIMPSGLLEDLLAQVKERYGPSKSTEVARMENLKRGSTYTPAENAIRLQQCSSESNKVWAIVKQRSEVGGEENERETRLLRSWDPSIYNNQRHCLSTLIRKVPFNNCRLSSSSYRNPLLLIRLTAFPGCLSSQSAFQQLSCGFF